MTAQYQAIGKTHSPAGALAARTAWMDNMEAPEPLRMAGTVIQVREGHEIFAEGDSPEVFFKVVSGLVRTCKFLSDGRRQIEAFHVEGDVFGFELGRGHVLSAEAVSECTLISYRRRGVEMLAQKDETVTRQLFQYAMHNLAMTRQDIADYLGLTIETVSRTLTQFERDGAIGLPNARQVVLRNIETLEDIAA